MKRAMAFLAVLLMITAVLPAASATDFTRKFNTDGETAKSSYKNGMVVMEFSKPKDLCWSYVPSAANLEFQVRIDQDSDPEFDWFGINITSDGHKLLGGGNGLSTILWRTGDGINSRVVEDDLKWDPAVIREIHSGSLYSDDNPPPEEDFGFGYTDWITFSMKKTGSKWDIRVNGISIVKNRYSTFDADMSRLLEGKDKITLTFFTNGTPGVLHLKSYTAPAQTTAPVQTTTTRATGAPTSPPTGGQTTGGQTSAATGNGTGTDAQTTGVDDTTESPADTTAATAADTSGSGQERTTTSRATETSGGGGGGFPVGGIVAIAVAGVAAVGGGVVLLLKKLGKI